MTANLLGPVVIAASDRRRAVLLLAAISVYVCPAAELDITCDPWLRPGIPFQISVTLPDPAPWVAASIDAQPSAFGSATRALITTIVSGPIVRGQVFTAITLEQLPDDDAIWLRVQAGTATAARRIVTIADAFRRSTPRPAVPATGQQRWEDLAVAELRQAAPTIAILDRAQAIAQGRLGWAIMSDADGDHALRRFADPQRASTTGTVVILRPASAPLRFAWWPALPSAAIAHAHARGYDIIELHPGGDRRGDGWLAEAAAWYLRHYGRCGVIDAGDGWAAAAVNARHPGMASWIRVGDPTVAATWDGAATGPAPSETATAGLILPPLPLPAALSRPVVVIYGSGEHAASRRRNRALADAMVATWTAHTGHAPQVLSDRDDLSALPANATWICVGNPLSHRLLAQRWPLLGNVPTWDDREIRFGTTAVHRSRSFMAQIRRPDPLRPGSWLIVIDGQAPWNADPQFQTGDWPLAGLPETVVQAVP